MTPKKIFPKKINKDIKKRRISRWFLFCWKSCKKMHQKKVTSKTNLTNRSKSEKSAYFRHVFANNFFWVNFFKTFSTNSNQREILRFLIPILNFLIKKNFCSYLHFLYTLIANAQETAQKTENHFLWMCLRIFLGNHQRVCITKLLKSLYPNAETLLPDRCKDKATE
jgi:hypothetical protein